MQLRLPDSFAPPSVTLFMDDAAFRHALGERIGQKVPRVQRRVRTQSSQLGFGPIAGKAGQQHTATVTSFTHFKPERMISVDDASPLGSGTRIIAMFVGSMNQFPSAPNAQGGISSMVLAPTALGTGMQFSPCQPGIPIAISVGFDKDCNWHGALFGQQLS